VVQFSITFTEQTLSAKASVNMKELVDAPKFRPTDEAYRFSVVKYRARGGEDTAFLYQLRSTKYFEEKFDGFSIISYAPEL
jgi:hypothetical protein